ncbi:hypothetical protein HUJ04_002993, partial [Dendroctonus ponderosae]
MAIPVQVGNSRAGLAKEGMILHRLKRKAPRITPHVNRDYVSPVIRFRDEGMGNLKPVSYWSTAADAPPIVQYESPIVESPFRIHSQTGLVINCPGYRTDDTSMLKMDHNSVLGMMHHTPFDNIGLYEQPKPRFMFKMPRVVPDQKAKYESDELFRRLSREGEVRYTGHRDRPQEERVKRFLAACQEGHTEIAFSATGTNLQLVFNPLNQGYMSDQCDFEKEPGK